AQQLRKWLIAWADRNDYNIYTDGLVVRTTIDSRLQALANQAVTRQGNQLQGMADSVWGAGSGWHGSRELLQAFVRESPEYRAARSDGLSDAQALKKLQADRPFMRALHQQKTQVQAGFLAIDPRNGEVRAWVGSRDFSQDAFDHVQQARRQPGSTFKPFVYGAAFEQGAKPTDTLMDQEVEIPLKGGEVWRPTDSTPPSGRAMSLQDGLAYSKNTITAQVMQHVGPARVVKLARAMGVRQSKLDPVPSLALGTSPVTLKEMVSAYGTIANGGSYIEPILVTRIENRKGKVLEEFHSASPESALSATATQSLLDAMRGVINRGTGTAIRNRYGIQADVAGKTGTTQDNTDGWFILMHPQLVAGAWVGFNDNRVTLRSDYWGQGAHSALPIVGDFFQQSLRSRLIDPKMRFEEHKETGIFATLFGRAQDWLQSMFAPAPAPEAPPERRAQRPGEPPAPAPEEVPPAPEAGPQEPEPVPEAPEDASSPQEFRGSTEMAPDSSQNEPKAQPGGTP
ncbi:MAG: penicillin-binding protein, partial [Zoogloea sp.]|nr:penicillin-binding protein [Zoogloea sp.]